MQYMKCCQNKLGRMNIIEENGKIVKLELNYISDPNILQKDTDILLEAEKQLEEYIEGKRKSFNLPLNPKGTEFMKKVWRELMKIPYGETRTYKQIAENIGNPKASRAVGMANNKNPLPIIIPCHRVIGSDGGLVGYALGLEIKETLLELETLIE